jgi:His/Glu/Gln/Arg/opine family amino acid ABC transporter permease subunit
VDWVLVTANLPLLLRGTLTTIELALGAFVAGTALGLLFSVGRTLGGRDADLLLGVAVDVVRGSPLLVQLLVIYLGASAVGLSLGPFAAALLGLSINAGAYLSEIFRGGIGSVPRGQTEAGLAVGLTPVRALWEIVLPQAVPVIIPAMMGFFIGLLKDTSLAYVLGLLELTRMGKNVMDRTFQPFEISLVVAAIYFILCFPLAQLVRVVDARMRARGLAQAHV